jgi:heme/copper-type cytochrome/quinol oxidase subunit 1
MNLTPPTKVVFYLSVLLVVVGIVANFVTIPVLSGLAFWIVVVGYVLLALGNVMKGF